MRPHIALPAYPSVDLAGDRSRISRGLALAAAITILLTASVPVSTVQAARVARARAQVISSELRVVARQSRIVVCEGEETVIGVRVQRVVRYRTTRTGRTRTGYQDVGNGQVIRATVADAATASVSPPFATTQAPGGIVSFNVTGVKKGRTKITLTETFLGRASPATVDVEVDECSYEFTTTSTWTIPDGFNPHMYQSWTARVSRDSTTGVYKATPLADNVAVGVPQRGCTPAFTTPRSYVGIEGTPDGNDYITFTIRYESVEAVAKVRCDTPVGAGTGQSQRNPATPDTLQFRMKASEDAWLTEAPHVLRAYIAVAGETKITIRVKKVRP